MPQLEVARLASGPMAFGLRLVCAFLYFPILMLSWFLSDCSLASSRMLWSQTHAAGVGVACRDCPVGDTSMLHRITTTVPLLPARRTAATSPYRGPVPIITHLHGAEGIGDESDGYSEAWYLPARCPNGFQGLAQVGACRRAGHFRMPLLPDTSV